MTTILNQNTLYSVLNMLFLSTLFGCKTAALVGPTFSDARGKVIHIRPLLTVEYQMPGNMSNLFDYSSRYANEVPTTMTVDLSSGLDYRQIQWRSSLNVDGGIWDYSAKGSATLDINIELVPFTTSETIEDEVQSRYEDYLNGPKGMNTGVRSRSPHSSDEELGDDIRPIPTSFRTYDIDGFKVISWTEGFEHQGSLTQYHAVQTGQGKHYLLFAFSYSISVRSEKEAQLLLEKVPDDIGRFMAGVKITPIKPQI